MLEAGDKRACTLDVVLVRRFSPNVGPKSPAHQRYMLLHSVGCACVFVHTLWLMHLGF